MDIRKTLGMVSSSDPVVRERAAVALGESVSPEGVRALIRLLGDDILSVRAAAARALGKSGDPAALEPLLTAQGSAEDPFRQAVSAGLLQYGAKHDIVPKLLARTRSTNPYARKAAVWVLGELRDLRAVAAVTEALKDEQDFVRSAAGFAVVKLKAKQQESAKPVKPSEVAPAKGRNLIDAFATFDWKKWLGKPPEVVKVEPPVRFTLKEHLDQLAKIDFEGDKKHKFTPPKKDNGMLAR
jgi:hypothetical protein